MRDIVQEFLAAEVPVVVHVSPSGARAASAGALIAWSAHVVAMAPGTFLFVSLGTLAIVYELVTPGVGAGGGLGTVLLVLALFSLAVLPIDVVGFVFLGVAAALFAVELLAPGVGAAAVLGSVALALGGVFLFPDDAGLSLSLATVVPTVTVVGVGVVVAGRLAVHARAAPPATGSDTLIGRQLTVMIEVASGRNSTLVFPIPVELLRFFDSRSDGPAR